MIFNWFKKRREHKENIKVLAMKTNSTMKDICKLREQLEQSVMDSSIYGDINIAYFNGKGYTEKQLDVMYKDILENIKQ